MSSNLFNMSFDFYKLWPKTMNFSRFFLEALCPEKNFALTFTKKLEKFQSPSITQKKLKWLENCTTMYKHLA